MSEENQAVAPAAWWPTMSKREVISHYALYALLTRADVGDVKVAAKQAVVAADALLVALGGGS